MVRTGGPLPKIRVRLRTGSRSVVVMESKLQTEFHDLYILTKLTVLCEFSQIQGFTSCELSWSYFGALTSLQYSKESSGGKEQFDEMLETRFEVVFPLLLYSYY